MFQIYNGDCLDVLRLLPSNKNYVVVTDPPYGIDLGKGKDKRRKGHGLGKSSYLAYDDSYENFVSRIIPRLNLSLNLASRGGVFTGPHIWEQRKADAIGGIFCPAGVGRTCWGFKTFMPVLLYGKYPNLHQGARIPNVLKDSSRPPSNGHPCPKPLTWMRWLVDLVTKPDDVVVDPFMGSGTTGVACLQAGLKFIGIEINEEYFSIAKSRIAEVEKTAEVAMIKTPWSEALVAELNARQKDSDRHPYTCGSGRRTDKDHLDGEGVLVATINGWHCPYCDYKQNWA